MSTKIWPGTRRGQKTVRAEIDLADVGGEADDGEDDVRLFADRAR